MAWQPWVTSRRAKLFSENTAVGFCILLSFLSSFKFLRETLLAMHAGDFLIIETRK